MLESVMQESLKILLRKALDDYIKVGKIIASPKHLANSLGNWIWKFHI